MTIHTIKCANVAQELETHVGERCSVSMSQPGADGYGVYVSGTLELEEGRFSVSLAEDRGCATVSFELHHVREARISTSGKLLINLNP